MYKRIHGNFVHFAPPPIRQVSGKLAHCVRSNSASQPASYAHKMDKIAYRMLIIHGGALSTVLDMSHEKYHT